MFDEHGFEGGGMKSALSIVGGARNHLWDPFPAARIDRDGIVLDEDSEGGERIAVDYVGGKKVGESAVTIPLVVIALDWRKEEGNGRRRQESVHNLNVAVCLRIKDFGNALANVEHGQCQSDARLLLKFLHGTIELFCQQKLVQQVSHPVIVDEMSVKKEVEWIEA